MPNGRRPYRPAIGSWVLSTIQGCVLEEGRFQVGELIYKGHVSYSLSPLKGSCIGDYIGEYYGGYYGGYSEFKTGLWGGWLLSKVYWVAHLG